jgi:hypothetical protein
MRKKYIVVAFSLLAIMVIEIIIYKKHKASIKTILRCYPSAVMYPHKDANKKINTVSFFHTISHCNYLEFSQMPRCRTCMNIAGHCLIHSFINSSRAV